MSGVGVSVLSGFGFTEGSTCALEGHVSQGKSSTPLFVFPRSLSLESSHSIVLCTFRSPWM